MVSTIIETECFFSFVWLFRGVYNFYFGPLSIDFGHFCESQLLKLYGEIFVLHSSFIRTSVWRLIKICPTTKNLSKYEGQTFVVRSWTNFFRSWTNFFRSWTNFFRSWTNFCQTSHICLYETTTKDKNCRIFLVTLPYSTKKPDKWKKHSVSIFVLTTVFEKMCPHLIWDVLSYLSRKKGILETFLSLGLFISRSRPTASASKIVSSIPFFLLW